MLLQNFKCFRIEPTMYTTMDPKLMCPTLTIMLTKTIKALCEVNIKFEKKLEISGSLHVRSDGEKILTCLIDEESMRVSGGALLQQRNTPETALAQQSAVMALLTASQQMAANRSPGLISPPTRTFTPSVSLQSPLDGGFTHLHLAQAPPAAHLPAPARAPSHNAVNDSHHAPVSVQSSSPQEVGRNVEPHRLPPVNSLIQNREVLLGMLQDKSRGVVTSSTTNQRIKSESSSTATQQHNKSSESSSLQHQQHYTKTNTKSTPTPGSAHALKAENSANNKAESSGSSAASKHQTHQSANINNADIKEEPQDKLQSAIAMLHHHNTTTTSSSLAPLTPSNGCAAAAAAPSLPPHLNLANLPPFPVLVNTAGVAPWPTSLPGPGALSGGQNTTTASGNGGGGNGGGAKTPRPEVESPPQDPEIVTTINSKGQKKFQCMFCGILLSTKNYLKNHINAVHTKARVYPCEICERYFYSAGALRIHKLRHHWAGSKKHKCSYCHDSFLLPVELRRHLLKKHGDTSSAGAPEVEEPAPGGGGTGGGGGKERGGGTPGLTIDQIRQFQLQEHLRAQQQLLEQEQAIVQLQQHMGGTGGTGGGEANDQGAEPLELSMRSEEQPEPGEITDAMHSQMTDENTSEFSQDHQQTAIFETPEMKSAKVAPIGQLESQSGTQEAHVIVQPEPPPEVTHMEVGDMHPNQNEMGIPDDDIEEEDDEEESRDLSPHDVTLHKRGLQSHVQYVPHPSPAIEIGNKMA